VVAGVVPLNHHMRAVLLCRTLLLSGDFFLGGVIAVNLAKLILRLRTLGVGQVLALPLASHLSSVDTLATTPSGIIANVWLVCDSVAARSGESVTKLPSWRKAV